MTLRRSAILTAAVPLPLAVALLTVVSWLVGVMPADASPAAQHSAPSSAASMAAPDGSASEPSDAAPASALVSPAVAVSAPSVAQQQPEPDEPTSDTTTSDEPASHDIVVRPDAEARPQQAEDRGGALQITVLLIVVAGIGTIAALAVRESRRRPRSSTQT